MAKIKKGLVRAVYRVKGEKLYYLPEFLHRKGVNVYFFKEIDKNECFIELDFIDRNKFFAICKNMCYNKLVLKYKGLLSPIIYLLKNLGLVLGAVAFTILIALSNNLILDVKVTGSGRAFSQEIKAISSEMGARKYTPFSSVDFDALESKILTSNPRFSFVAVKKQGNVLVIDTVLSKNEPSLLGSVTTDLVSNYDGIVEEITVLRGTPLVEKGQEVKRGDKLVGAYLLGKGENVYKTFVLARVKILQKTEYFYKCDNPSEKDVSIAYALAEFNFGGDVKEKTHAVEKEGIRVTLFIRRTIYGG